MLNKEMSMYNQNRCFSLKVKVPWGAVVNNYKLLERCFTENVEHLFDAKVTTCIRTFRASSMCRFTIVFAEWQSFPDKKQEALQKIVKQTILDLIEHKDVEVYKN